MTAKHRLAIVVSHPIQHFVHFYRALALCGDIDLRVFFCSRIGLEEYHDREMNTRIKWSGDMLAGYAHEFLPESGRIKGGGFWKIDNPSIGAALRGFAPDAVMLYGYSQLTQLRALAWCRLNRTPVLMTGDGNFVTRRSPLYGALRTGVLKLLLAQVSGFLTVGDQNEAMLAAVGIARGKMHRVPFPIDESAYLGHRARRAEERARIRSLHGIAGDALVLLYVGKLSARKRPLDLIEAARLLPQPRPVLLYCGDGPERAALEAAIATSGVPAVLAGFVNTDQLPAYYCAADVLVHPSEHDPHPLICSEAACIGLPMLLSDMVGAVGPSDVARAGENALVYPCGDVAALALALARGREAFAAMAAHSVQIFETCNMAASVAGLLGALRATGKRKPA